MRLSVYIVVDLTRPNNSSICGVFHTRELAERNILGEVENSIYSDTTSKDFIIIEEFIQ